MIERFHQALEIERDEGLVLDNQNVSRNLGSQFLTRQGSRITAQVRQMLSYRLRYRQNSTPPYEIGHLTVRVVVVKATLVLLCLILLIEQTARRAPGACRVRSVRAASERR